MDTELDQTVMLNGAANPPNESVYVFPASFSQRRLWFLQQLEPGQTSYLVPMAWRLRGSLDIAGVNFALNGIVERHDTMRTSFAVENCEPVQVVHPHRPFEIKTVDLSEETDPDAVASELASLEANTPFDLAQEPMFRCKLLQLHADEFLLLVTVHHIVFDGWSKGIWIREFSALYREYVRGTRAGLPELTIQYGDFAAWQQAHLSGELLEAELAFWKNALDGAPTLLDIPKDRPRTKDVSPDGATLPFAFDKNLTEGLRKLALETKSTLFMVMLAALHVLLARYSGQDDILVGTPIANRERLELEPLIGFFVNTLVMRGRVNADDSFYDVLSEVKRFTLDAYDHQDMPFEKLVEHLQPERSLGHNPLFQVMFALQNMPRGSVELPELTIVSEGGGRLKTKLDLFIGVVDAHETLRGSIEYSLALYDAATIERMASHYQHLLTRLVDDPGQIVAEVSFLDDAEAERLSVEWNQTAVEYPRDKGAHQLFEEQVMRTPEREAVAFGDRILSYTELNERSNRLAHVLLGRGVQQGHLVGVCLHRCEDLPTTLLAILKTGAAYLPMDPYYPRERLGYILGDAKARLVITQDSVLSTLPVFEGDAICMEALRTELAAAPSANLNRAVDPEALAYVLHTSGSTGKPKGVEVTQRNLVNFLCSMRQVPGMSAADTLLAVTTLSFDISGLELFLPLIVGARVVIASREQAIDAVELMQLIERWEVNVLQATPATWLMLLEAGWKGNCNLKVLCGGEALPPELAIRLSATCDQLWNMYGPTETTIWSAVARIEAGSGERVSIGHPIANTTLRVLDAKQQLVPVGVLGELYIGGDGVGRGYWGKPELTAERFVIDPFNASLAAKMFRTGDMCRRRPDGQIEYLGRADHQVKIRGFRIELGEIEAVLARMPAVQQCVVVAREDTRGDKRLAAYVVADPDYRPEAEMAGDKTDSETEQVSRWAAAWDDSYQGGANAADVTFNLAGWNSSYTGEAIPAEEMRVWVDTTVERILRLNAQRVWEIGCGTGLLLFRVAPFCQRYHGTDISAAALGALTKQIARPELHLLEVTLANRPAHQADNGCPGEKFDLVVLNSVVQYFPDAEYLVEVLTSAIDALGDSGSIFIGDVRNHALLNMFHASVETQNASDKLTAAQLLQRIEKAVRQDAELLVDPEFFLALKRKNPRISRVEIQLKRGATANELTRFRYDVTLHVGKPVDHVSDVAWIDWTAQDFTAQALRSVLEESQPELVGFTKIPNAQLQFDVAIARLLAHEDGPPTVGDMRRNLQTSFHEGSMEPEVMWRTVEGLPYHLEMRPSRSGSDGCFDAMLVRTDNDKAAEVLTVRFPGESEVLRPWQALCNNPLKEIVDRALIPKLREWMTERLPEYMVPTAVVLLDAMPLSSNGKINRKALPQPEYSRHEDVPYLAPRTECEIQLAAIWSEALHVANIGVADDFFSLGGHSLLGTQIVSRIRTTFQVEVPLRALFETPTLEGLAAVVEGLLLGEHTFKLPELKRADRSVPQPLSFAQQRLWFLDQLAPGNAFYNMPTKWRMQGALNVSALELAINEIVARHEVLRTTFGMNGVEPTLIVSQERRDVWSVRDLSALSDVVREEQANVLVSEEARRPFDLQHGPVFRATLLRLSAVDHVLVLNTHHIASDGWSLGVMRHELFTLYEAFVAEQPSPLAPLAVQYADYAAWQRTHFEGDVLDRQLAYWKEHLRDASPSIDLPTDRPRPPVQTYRGSSEVTQLPIELVDSLNALSRKEGATVFMTLLAGFCALLSRYSGQQDVVVGSAIAGRTHGDTENLIGLFVNTLALRTDLSGDPSFRQLLGRVRKTTINAYAHQDVPFERLVEELKPVRDSSRSPLYQVMLVLQNTPNHKVAMSGVQVTAFGSDNETSQTDLVLSLVEHPNGIRATLKYNTDLFNADTIERMLEHYRNLLERLSQNPDEKVSQVSFLGEAERHQLLVDWNKTEGEYRRDACVHQLFEEQVARTPHKRAVVFEETSLTFSELNGAANRLAHYLQSRGVRARDLVAVYVERSIQMLVALLAVQKSGAAYVPLDPSHSPERLRMVLEDANVACLIAQNADIAVISGCCREVVYLEGDAEAIAAESGENLPRATVPEDLLNVIFTSGSTGRPKGVEVPHRGIVNALTWMCRQFEMGTDDVTVAVSNYAFDMSLTELFGPLITGGTVLIASQDVVVNGEELARLMMEHKATVMIATPTTLGMLLEAGFTFEGMTLQSGGEALSRELVRKLLQAGKGVKLYNGYGPTEASLFSTCHQVVNAEERIAIGRPIANTQVYLLDRALQPVPVGVKGGIYISGDGVTRGYLGRPDLTDERFISNPFLSNSRLYFTGDVGRWDATGDLEYLGRADHQVKIRGFRIELGEIEATLALLADVRDCVVVVREDVPGDKRLVAYVVSDTEFRAAQLRTLLKATLPDYMIPSTFVMLERLPLNPNGKLDRNSLPDPSLSGTVGGDGLSREARTGMEVLLAEIWKDVLRISSVNMEDDFFELGGHSLLATQMVSRARQMSGVDIPLIAIFSNRTLEAFAKVLDVAVGGEDRIEHAPLVAGVRPERLPLSYGQQRLWFLDQLEPGSPFYNVPVRWRMRGVLDTTALRLALNEIVARHEILRTTYVMQEGEVMQVIAPAESVSVAEIDLTGTPETEREQQIRVVVAEESLLPFDLQLGPIFRAKLVTLSAEDHVLALSTHHIATDGWSVGVLRQELFTLYEAFVAGIPSPLAALPLQYADYAIWQRSHLEGAALDRQLNYWKQHLQDAPPSIDLPTDRPRPAVQTYRGASRSVVLPLELLVGLKGVNRKEGTTLFMTALAAFNVLLSRYSGQEDIVVGSAIAGRTRSETEKLIGLFVNTLALRTDLSGDPTFRELQRRVRETTINAYAHQDVPFERVVEEINPVRDSSRSPLYQVMLLLQNTPSQKTSVSGLEIGPLGSATQTSQMDLTLNLSEHAQGITATLTYNTDLFDGSTIDRMLEHYERLLTAVVTDASVPVSELLLLSPEEIYQLTVGFNDTAADFRDVCLHQLIAEQSLRTPDATALIAGDQSLSFAQLEHRANRVAHELIARGVVPDTLVGIYFERSAEMLVAILGVLKAGGAYVPLDPKYPAQRIAHILEGARPKIVLAQESIADQLAPETPWISLSAADAQPETTPKTSVQPHHLAYVLFTSGSTGKPKGVAIEHRSAASFIQWALTAFTPAQLSGVLLSTSICFDLSIFEMFSPLSSGGKIILSENALFLPTLDARSEVTLINTVPSAMAELLRSNSVPASVRTVNLAGEALSADLVEKIYSQTSVEQVFNLYGPTEDTTYSTYTLVPRGAAVTIGRPLTNSQAFILDRKLQVQPVGVPGELYLAGVGLARGYLYQTELTTERFVPNPFAPGARMYKTGDLCRWLPGGTIEYLGRLDHQVKVRGFRIELGEIEAALAAVPHVRECVVIAREDVSGDKRLVAYVVADVELNQAQLRTLLKATLPDYMIPSAFVMLERLPLNPNGKLDRNSLPDPSLSGIVGGDGLSREARTGMEVLLAEIWKDVLRISSVNMEDDFFELGGHSLLATQMVSRARQMSGVDIPLIAIFSNRTLEAFARVLDVAVGGEDRIEHAPLVAGVRPEHLPLSYGQQRLWFLDQLEPGSPFYNVPMRWRMRGVLDTTALRLALNEIVARHEILRTTYVMQEGEVMQVIAPAESVSFTEVDLTNLPEADREQQARVVIAEEGLLPFDLQSGPMFRAKLVKLSADEHVVALLMHHIATDGWSAGILRQELFAFYESFAAGQPAALAPLTLQYADYALWQRAHLEGAALDRQLNYWKQHLQDAPPSIDLPTDRPRPAVQTYRGASRVVVFPLDLLVGLKGVNRKEGTTLFMTALAAFNVLLSRYSGQEDIVVGSAIAGRTHSETEKLIGLFVNTLALRTDLSGNPTFRDLLRRVRETTVNAYAHQDVPFERVVEEINPIRDSSRSPLYQVMLLLQNTPSQKAGMSGLEMTSFGSGTETSQMDLILSLSEGTQGITATLTYNTDLFDGSTIDRMLEHYRNLLTEMVAGPDQKIATVSYLGEAERNQLLVEWNQTAADYRRNVCVHQLFEEQAARTPDKSAIVFGDQTLTYAELDADANRLAHHLQSCGVQPRDLVAVFVERSARMLVALLAVQKCGAAYVPLDPGYPAERSRMVLEGAEISVLITETALLKTLPAYGGNIVDLDADASAISSRNCNQPQANVTSSDLVYVIFTSGSTGRPKGVEVPHRGVVNYLSWASKQLELSDSDVFAALSSYAFDMSIPELYAPLMTGGTVLIISRDVAANPRELASVLSHNGASVMIATPTTWSMLLDVGFNGERMRRITAGEGLPPELLRRLMENGKGAPLFNGYGPSETSIICVSHRFQHPSERVVIGKPIANVQLYVLDRQMQPVPVGVSGQLYVAGDGITRGYLGRPDLTTEKYLENPFSDSSKLYATGDVVRYLEDGRIEFLGRADHQVKIRGFRIELGEIETTLAALSDIRECVVIVREDVPGDKRLVAYVVSTAEVEQAKLRTQLRETLPDYMVPSAFVRLEQLPLTPNGKVDRNNLPQPDLYALTGGRGQAPRTQMEILLAEVWREVLGLPVVNIDDDFFQLGGHSLLAASMISKLSEALGYNVRLSSLFEAPTIEALASAAERQGREQEQIRTIVPIRRTGTGPALFCVSRPNVNALGFMFLSRAIPKSFPIYGLQSHMENDGSVVPFTPREIEEKASEYVAAMREVQPDGPYFLIGYCEGGHIAFEMARQLELLKLEVGILAMLDLWPVENTISRARHIIRNYGRVVRFFIKASNRDRLAMLGRKLHRRSAIPVTRTALNTKGLEKLELEVEARRYMSTVAAARYWPGKDFKPTMYNGDILVFRTSPQPFNRIRNKGLGWGSRVLGEVDIVEVPGYHAQILRTPGVEVVAQELEARIGACLARSTKDTSAAV